MLGAIAGDIIGSPYESRVHKSKEFDLFTERSRFTDDTVLTVAVAHWLLEGGDLVDHLHEYANAYPHAGYGGTFANWVMNGFREPYNSWGNGSAMRVSPAAYVTGDLASVLSLAEDTAKITHDHPEGVRGAQATAAAVFLAASGESIETIRDYIAQNFYSLDQTLEEIRPRYVFDVSCQGSVPQSIQSFLEADSFEDAVRNAISLGGDADTMACIAGAIAEPYFGIPDYIERETMRRLDDRLRRVVDRFRKQFVNSP